MKMKKIVASAAALSLTAAVAVGGTLAYLKDNTGPIVNTFTVGNIDIDLAETTSSYHIVPGKDIPKDPKVTVEGDSETCWLFVKVDEENWIDALSYSIAEGWTELEGQDGVYYREVTSNSADQYFDVLTDNKVTVSTDLSKATIDGIGENEPTLTFTAYAVQKEGFATPAAAWTEASKQ